METGINIYDNGRNLYSKKNNKKFTFMDILIDFTGINFCLEASETMIIPFMLEFSKCFCNRVRISQLVVYVDEFIYLSFYLLIYLFVSLNV